MFITCTYQQAASLAFGSDRWNDCVFQLYIKFPCRTKDRHNSHLALRSWSGCLGNPQCCLTLVS